MAVTKIIPIKAYIGKSVDYICNPAKTDGSLLIHSEKCYPETAALEFQYYMNQARAGGNTAGRHLIQSFAPGEVTPEAAHEIGRKLAGEILKGEYAYVMATHVDRGHVHNHFVWCAANTVTHKRYRSNKNTYREIREASDRLCEENSLSVVVPRGVGKDYAEYSAERQGTSWKAKLKSAIDTALSESASFEGFIKGMESRGYEIKRGKYISFRAPEQERFTRAKTLGVDYSEDALKQKISRNTAPIINTKTEPTVPVTPPTASAPKLPPKIPALNGGLLQRIKVIGDDLKRRERGEAPKPIDSYDLKLMQEYGGSEGVLTLREQCRRDMAELQNSMDAAGERIQKLSNLLTNIADYNRTKPIYKQYKETRLFSERFRKKHAEDIEAHECAKSRLEKVKRPLPKVKDIDKKIAELKETNAESSRRYSQKDREYRDWGKLHSYFRSLETRLESPPSQRRDPARHVKSNDLSL